jgi:hypothetical protein
MRRDVYDKVNGCHVDVQGRSCAAMTNLLFLCMKTVEMANSRYRRDLLADRMLLQDHPTLPRGDHISWFA